MSPQQSAPLAALAAQVTSIALPADAHYARLATPWNVSVPSTPLAVVEAADAADIARTLRFATAHRIPVAVQCTGHGASADLSDAILVGTGRLTECTVHAEERWARVGAGVAWQQVLDAAAPARPRGAGRLVTRRGRRGLHDGRRPRAAGPHARPRRRSRARARGGHGRRTPAARDARRSTRTCSGRCAAAREPSASSPRSSSTCCRSPSSTAARSTSTAPTRPGRSDMGRLVRRAPGGGDDVGRAAPATRDARRSRAAGRPAHRCGALRLDRGSSAGCGGAGADAGRGADDHRRRGGDAVRGARQDPLRPGRPAAGARGTRAAGRVSRSRRPSALVAAAGPGSGSPQIVVEVRQLGGAWRPTAPARQRVLPSRGRLQPVLRWASARLRLGEAVAAHGVALREALVPWTGTGALPNFAPGWT